MLGNKIRHFLMLASGFLVIVGYQNCAQESLQFADSYRESELASFSYAYKEASPLYLDLKVSDRSASSVTGNSRELQIVGAVTPSNGEQVPLRYSFSVEDGDGNIICPVTLNQDLVAGDSLIEHSCVTASRHDKVYFVKTQVIYKSKTYSFVHSFGGI